MRVTQEPLLIGNDACRMFALGTKLTGVEPFGFYKKNDKNPLRLRT